MAEHPKCKTCDHWIEPEDCFDGDPVFSVVGTCKKVAHSADMTEWDDDLNNVLMPEYRGFLAVVSDGSGYRASLDPTANFYCPHHSALSKAHPTQGDE